MNSLVFIVCAKNLFICAKQCLLDLKYYFLCGRLSKIKRWPVVGFCPRATSAGVFGINLSALFPMVGAFEGGAQHNEPGNRTIMLEHSQLAIELYNFKFRRSPLVRKTEFGVLSTPLAGQSQLLARSGISL